MNSTFSASDGNQHAEEMMALILAIREQGIMDPDMMRLYEKYPRRKFLNPGYVRGVLKPNSAAPIPCGQLQSAPSTVSTIIQALDLEPNHKVLEIGTGSGYQAALIASLCRRFYTIERFRTLVDDFERRIETMRIGNIVMRFADGMLGWPEQDNFDSIIINAGISSVPSILSEQLKVGGRLIAPIIQTKATCNLTLHVKVEQGFEAKKLATTRYLPIISGTAYRL